MEYIYFFGGDMKFICIERGILLSDAGSNEDWQCPQPRQPLISLMGETEDEVRQKLNAYLASPEGVRSYGTALRSMPEGSLKVTETACRNGFNWKWEFEIVPYLEHLYKKPAPVPLPVYAYEEGN